MKKLEIVSNPLRSGSNHLDSEPATGKHAAHSTPGSNEEATNRIDEEQSGSAIASQQYTALESMVEPSSSAKVLTGVDCHVSFDGTFPTKARPHKAIGVGSLLVLADTHLNPAASSEFTQADLERLGESICKLWKETRKQQKLWKASRSEFARVDRQLAQQLSQYKSALAAAGRNGKWSEFLRNAGIAKATADRYVARVNAASRKAQSDGNLLTEEIYQRALTELVKRWSRQVREKRFNPEQVQRLLQTLSTELVPVSKQGDIVA